MRLKNKFFALTLVIASTILGIQGCSGNGHSGKSLNESLGSTCSIIWGTLGDGRGQLNNPKGIAVDKITGEVFVADTDNDRIQVFTNNGEYLRQWGSLGSNNAQFNKPLAIAIDSTGRVLVADSQNNRVQVFNTGGVYLATIGGPGEADGQFSLPTAVTTDTANNIYVADYNHNKIQKFAATGAFIKSWASPSTRELAMSVLDQVIASHAQGTFNVTVYDNEGGFLFEFGAPGTGNGQFRSPVGMGVNTFGDIFVADVQSSRMQKFSRSGTYISQFGQLGEGFGEFTGPYGVDVDMFNNIFVADSTNNRIQKLAPNCFE